MAISSKVKRRQYQQHQRDGLWIRFMRFSSKNSFRLLLILVFLAIVPPIFFHFRLRRFQQLQSRKCSWMNNPPLVCAHGGDSTKAFPNTMSAYRSALLSQVDCIEIDISRSSDGVLFALHDRDLQRISGNSTAKVGHLSSTEIKEMGVRHEFLKEFPDQEMPTMEDALLFTSRSVRQVILDAKVGPPSYEKGLARDILSVVLQRRTHSQNEWRTHTLWCQYGANFFYAMQDKIYHPIQVQRTLCKNCIVWAKSDTLARDLIRQRSDITVGYIVMNDPSTGARTNLLRMKGAGVVGTYHPLIDEKLVTILHGRSKKVYAWTVDDAESMQRMLFERVDGIVTSDPSMLQRLMQDIRTQCLEEGFPLPR